MAAIEPFPLPISVDIGQSSEDFTLHLAQNTLMDGIKHVMMNLAVSPCELHPEFTSSCSAVSSLCLRKQLHNTDYDPISKKSWVSGNRRLEKL